jgi:hypothetical protein
MKTINQRYFIVVSSVVAVATKMVRLAGTDPRSEPVPCNGSERAYGILEREAHPSLMERSRLAMHTGDIGTGLHTAEKYAVAINF